MRALPYCGELQATAKPATGYGKASIIHSSDLLELSSDLPIVIEITDTEANIEKLKQVFDETGMIGSALITEEKVKIIKYGN